MNNLIVHEVNEQRQRLQTAAGTTSDPAELHRIAQAMANVNRAAEIYQAGAIDIVATTEDGSPAAVAVNDGRATYMVVIGRSTIGARWQCGCISQGEAYKAACSHKIAAKLASAAAAHQREIQARAQRKADLAAAEQAHQAATTARMAAERRFDQAKDEETRRWGIVRNLSSHVYWDEKAAQTEAQASEEAQSSQQAELVERRAAA